jgi:hypothetical protein
MLLEFVFTQNELKILDDPLPKSFRKQKPDKDEENNTQEVVGLFRISEFYQESGYLVASLESRFLVTSLESE